MSILIEATDNTKNEDLLIAIKSKNNQTHVGFYIKTDGEVKVFHFIDTNRLELSSEKGYKLIKITSFDEINILYMIANLLSLACKQQPTPIYFGPCGGGKFDEQLNYAANPGDGLSCSRFIIEVFKSSGFKFIDETDWPSRQEDIDWANDIICDRLVDVTEEYERKFLSEQKSKVANIVRIRPEEVGAAVHLDNPPHRHSAIKDTSDMILMELQA